MYFLALTLRAPSQFWLKVHIGLLRSRRPFSKTAACSPGKKQHSRVEFTANQISRITCKFVPFSRVGCCLVTCRAGILLSKHGVADLVNKHIRNARVASMGGLYDTVQLHEILLHLSWEMRIASLSLHEGLVVLAQGAMLAGRIGSHARWLE